MLSSALLQETRSFGGSRSITSPKKNFFIYYELDEEVVNTYLCAEWYDGDDDSSWVRLEPVEDAGAAGPSGSASGAANAEA